jgi:hypothetical protein
MAKITLEITEVVNGLTITENPITLTSDGLLATASTIASSVVYSATGAIAATNVQAALTELDTEKMAIAGGTFTGDVGFTGASSSMKWDTSADQLKFNDGVKAVFGAANSLTDADLEIYHISGNSYLRDTGAGTLFIQTDGPGISLGSTTNNAALSATFVPGAAGTLYHNYSKKFETTSSGIDVTGLVEFDSLSGTGSVAITNILDEDNMASNSATALATQQSIKAYVDAQQDTVDTFAEILALSNTTGGTDLSVSTNDKVQFRDAAIYINSSTDGQLDIVADTEIQLAATTVDLNGVLDVSGNIVVGGTVDGRDVASDGTKLDGLETKLDGIEASATADQSNAEIRAAVEAATDSNVFTDADHTKLNGVAANATANVGDITNVIAGNGLSGGGTSGEVTLAVDTSIVVTKSDTQTLTNKTLTAPDINTPDIDGGTIDGTVIGGATPAAGTFSAVNIASGTPTILLNDTDGNEQFKIVHQGGNSYVSSFGTGSAYGAMTFYRNKTPADAKAVFKFNSNGDFIALSDDGTTNVLKVSATNDRVGINTSSPAVDLDVVGTTASTQLNIKTSLALNTATTIKNDTNLSGWVYTGKTLDVNTEQPVANGVYLADSGRKLYITGSNGDFIDRYELSTPYDVTTAGTKTVSGNVGDTSPQDLVIADSGTKAYVLGTQNDVIRHFTLGAGDADPYDITSWSLANAVDITSTDNTPTGFDIKADGTKVWIVGSQNDSIYQFTMSTPFDISTIGSLVTYDMTADGITNPTGISVSADGTRIYVLDQAGDDITRYDLSTSYSIASSSITKFSNFYVGNEGVVPQGLWVDESNKVVLVVDSTENSVQQYTTDANTAVVDTDNLFIDGPVSIDETLFVSGVIRGDKGFSIGGYTTLQGVVTLGNTVIGNSAGTSATMGHVSGTNSVTVGRSTKTQTVSIHDAVTESGETATVNIGTSGASGSTTNINIGGGVGTCTTTVDADLVIPGETPASATAAGTQGQIAWDVNYIYICTATNTWKRVAIGTW